MLTVDIKTQIASDNLPSEANIKLWAKHAFMGSDNCEVSIAIVDSNSSQALNRDYLNNDKPTNVLSFPAEAASVDGITHLGDIVICAAIVISEAAAQKKQAAAHWAHLTIHGMLHLQGYDHNHDDEANKMESLEIKLLAELNLPNPYTEQHDTNNKYSTTNTQQQIPSLNNEPITAKQ